MVESYMNLSNCAKIGAGCVAIGYNAGLAHATGTGCAYLGHQAGLLNSSGSMSYAIGANASLSTTTGDAIAIGNSASITNTSASSSCLAIGNNAVCTSLNSIMLGGYFDSILAGPMILEHGRGHQNFYTVTTATQSLDLNALGSAGAMIVFGGWIEFLDAPADCVLTLPSDTYLRPLVPNSKTMMGGELLIHNYGTKIVTVATTDGAFWEGGNIRANSTCIVKYRVDVDTYFEFFS